MECDTAGIYSNLCCDRVGLFRMFRVFVDQRNYETIGKLDLQFDPLILFRFM